MYFYNIFLFRLCTPFEAKDSRDVSNFFENVIGNFEDVVQYNNDNREFEGIKNTNVTIKTLCDIMTKSSGGTDKYQFKDMFTDALLEINDEVQNANDPNSMRRVWDQVPGILYR